MRYVPGNAQHIGSREEQEDSFGFSSMEDGGFVRHGGFVGAVADGMGGLEHGREASQAAMRAFLCGYGRKQETESIPEALERSVREANEVVVRMGRDGGAGTTAGIAAGSALGSTLVAAALRDRSLYWVSVGDSAVYLWRNRRLTQLNCPHTFARVLNRRAAVGEISREQAEQHPDREALTSYLGEPMLREIDRNRRGFHLKQGDQIVVCTDGVFKTLSSEQMQAAMGDSPQRSCEALVERTLAAGEIRQDNLTVLAIAAECEPGDGEPAGERTGEGLAAGSTVMRQVRNRRRVLILALSGAVLAAAALPGWRAWRRLEAAPHRGVDTAPPAAPQDRSQAAPRPGVRAAPVKAPLAAGSRATTSLPEGASAQGTTAAGTALRVSEGKAATQLQSGVGTKMPKPGEPF